jgi:hypothetical protein
VAEVLASPQHLGELYPNSPKVTAGPVPLSRLKAVPG